MLEGRRLGRLWGPSDPAGGIRLIVRRLIVPVILAVLAAHATSAGAQGAFPAPLPGNNASPFPPVNGAPVNGAPVNGAVPPRNDPAFPPVNGATGRPIASAPAGFSAGGGGFSPPQPAGPQDDCMKAFLPMRQDAEKKGAAIKEASEHHATPDVACKLIKNFAASELKLLKYIETNQARCGIPPQVSEQLKGGHKNTEKMQAVVCTAAAQGPRGPAGPTLSDVLGSPTVPEATAAKKSGGTTFDTLSGNVLSR
jgi:hypothetical protein